jgi:hypothetical protein
MGSDVVGPAQQGQSVALSGNGNTLAFGGPNDNGLVGATWIFTRSGGVWTQQGLKITATDTIGPTVSQGDSVALSADGFTLASGGNGDNSGVGATWIYVSSTTGVWTEQAKLVGSGVGGPISSQGTAVALSGDGNTVASGGFRDASLAGAVWVFTRFQGIWSQRNSKLVGTGAVGGAEQGFKVALSGDANTMAEGGFHDNAQQGAVWVFI